MQGIDKPLLISILYTMLYTLLRQMLYSVLHSMIPVLYMLDVYSLVVFR